MRRFLLPALMISLLLTGCGSAAAAAEQRIEKQRDSLAQSERLSFTAEITASYPQELFRCTLDCSASAEEVTVEVIEPELIAGVRAHLRDGETEVEYDSVRLSVGGAGQSGLHPVSAIPLLCSALKTGSVIRAWTERADGGDLIAAELFADEAYGLTVWFDSASLIPVHAELSRDGTVIINCEIHDFKIERS